MRRQNAIVASAVLFAVACGKAPPDANPEFSDATVYTLRAFEGSEVDLAFGLRALEQGIYLSMDVASDDVRDRATTPQILSPDDLVDMDIPEGADPADALPVAVAGISAFTIEENALIPLLTDQTVVEPYSPDKYDRSFLETTDACWTDRSCDTLLTYNDLVKKNFLMEVPYILFKDFRWVDMALPDPAEVPEGEEAVNEGEPRWGYVARSWTAEQFSGEGGNTIVQSYSIEVWVPRDGRGFVRDGSEENTDGGEWTTDSDGEGTLRFLAVWAETNLPGVPAGDDTVVTTTMVGIDNNVQAHEEWLAEHVSR